MCNFCGVWCCVNCMPARKRPHPLSKDGSGKRYNVCQRCDTKYLNLQLGHVNYFLIEELRIEQDIVGAGDRKDIRGVVELDQSVSRVPAVTHQVQTVIRKKQVQDIPAQEIKTLTHQVNQKQNPLVNQNRSR